MKLNSRDAVSMGVTGVIVVLVVIAAGSLIYAGSVTSSVSTTTQTTTTPVVTTVTTSTTITQTATQTTTAVPAVVNLDVVPDWGGAGYDAFVIPTAIGAAPPTPANATAGPGPNSNNLTVSAGVPITFVISNIDTAVIENFTGPVTTPLSIYNDTDAGQVALQYQPGQSIQNMPVSHTFTINSLGLNIPIPPGTVVTFTYTFTKAGVYRYLCMTPCGPGMTVVGYMMGFVNVK